MFLLSIFPSPQSCEIEFTLNKVRFQRRKFCLFIFQLPFFRFLNLFATGSRCHFSLSLSPKVRLSSLHNPLRKPGTDTLILPTIVADYSRSSWVPLIPKNRVHYPRALSLSPSENPGIASTATTPRRPTFPPSKNAKFYCPAHGLFRSLVTVIQSKCPSHR